MNPSVLPPTPPRSVLFQTDTSAVSVVVLDIPRSIEEAQLPAGEIRSGKQPARRLVSAPPIELPFPTPEPKVKHGQVIDPQGSLSSAAYISELTTQAAVREALDCLSDTYTGPYCLPRVYAEPKLENESMINGSLSKKRTRDCLEEGGQSSDVHIPPGAHYLEGTIQSDRNAFISQGLSFNLIVLDPPWPNRSARRKKGNYRVVDDLSSIRDLLLSIPVKGHLSSGGFVAVWVTNAPRFTELLTDPRIGIFAEWGVEFEDEWTWLKVTSRGEPMVAVDSTWRKPWERLIIARGKTGRLTKPRPVGSKVIVAVPDVHSRKPNLRGLFEGVLGEEYRGLEVFARNLTSGWLSWGNEVLHFQHHKHWRDSKDEDMQA